MPRPRRANLTTRSGTGHRAAETGASAEEAFPVFVVVGIHIRMTLEKPALKQLDEVATFSLEESGSLGQMARDRPR